MTRNPNGSVLIELALILPLLLTIAVAIVDFWQLESGTYRALIATRHGARAASAAAYRLVELEDLEDACNDDSVNSAVLDAGVLLAAQYLNSSGLDSFTCTPSGSPTRSCGSSTFQVSAEFETLCEGGHPFRTVRVDVTSNSWSSCLFCVGTFSSFSNLAAHSTFAVEADCSRLEDLPCS